MSFLDLNINDYKQELFRKAPLKQLVAIIIAEKFSLNGKELIVDYIDWSWVKLCCEKIIAAEKREIPWGLEEVLIEAWKCLTGYLKKWGKLYNQKDKLKFMDEIFRKNNKLTKKLLKSSHDLKGLVLCLDTGLITDKKAHGGYIFGSLYSNSETKLAAAINWIRAEIFSDFDFTVLEQIKNNKGVRYFNLDTQKFINSNKISDFEFSSDKYQVVSDKIHLWYHVIDSLKEENKKVEAKARVYLKRSTENEETTEETEEEEEEVKKKERKKTIPKSLKDKVWKEYNGKKYKGTCYCCQETIEINNWHAGHVISESSGGETKLSNLRPVCASCNLSMGTQNMKEFKKNHWDDD